MDAATNEANQNSKISCIEDNYVYFELTINKCKIGDVVEISVDHDPKSTLIGRVVKIQGKQTIVQFLDEIPKTPFCNIQYTFTGKPFTIALSENILGRTFCGLGKPLDNLDPIISEHRWNINLPAVNPCARVCPDEMLETGITSIDLLNPIARGQSVAIVSSAGLEHHQLAAHIACHSKLASNQTHTDNDFVIVFAGIGIDVATWNYFKETFAQNGLLEKTVAFLHTDTDFWMKSLVTPYLALATAEYLAFECGKHVRVIMTDMTIYMKNLYFLFYHRIGPASYDAMSARFWRETMCVFERAGKVVGSKGSITLLPVLTVSTSKNTSPWEHRFSNIDSLRTMISAIEGCLLLESTLHTKGIKPAINPGASSSKYAQKIMAANHCTDMQLISLLMNKYYQSKDILQVKINAGEDCVLPEEIFMIEWNENYEENILNQKGFNHRAMVDSYLVVCETLEKIVEPYEQKFVRRRKMYYQARKAWKLERFLWIGFLKEDASYCHLSWLPKDIVKEISFVIRQATQS